MTLFVGTKLIKVKPMTRADYNLYRGWDLPDNENGADAGFLYEYLDGGQSNDSRHEGYISWSPSDAFNESYKTSGDLSFGHVVELLKRGFKCARQGWNGKGMFIYMVDGSNFKVSRPPLDKFYTLGTDIEYQPHIDMKYADGTCGVWVASHSDMLMNDWSIVQ